MPKSSALGSCPVAGVPLVVRSAPRAVPGDYRRASFPLAIPEIDALLDGGLPYGAITEVFGDISSGRTTVAHALVSAATRAGEFVAWVDLPNSLDPDSARTAGVSLERVLWISPVDRVTAFRAVEHVLDAGGFRLVVLDLDGPLQSRSLMPVSAWLRVARHAVRCDAAIVVLSTSHIEGAFATIALEVRSGRRAFVGEGGPSPIFEGTTNSIYLRKYKFGPLRAVPVDFFASTRA